MRRDIPPARATIDADGGRLGGYYSRVSSERAGFAGARAETGAEEASIAAEAAGV